MKKQTLKRPAEWELFVTYVIFAGFVSSANLVNLTCIWDKVFKSGLSKFSRREPLKNLLGSLLNTLSHMILKADS